MPQVNDLSWFVHFFLLLFLFLFSSPLILLFPAPLSHFGVFTYFSFKFTV